MPLHVGVIVEGQGENQSIQKLLYRIWRELLGGDFIKVLPPFRKSQGILLKEHGLMQAVDEVKVKLGPALPGGARKLVLILIDAEINCPRKLAPKLVKWGREARSDADIACVMPNPMFETWFAAAAASLAGVNGLPPDLTEPDDPEGKRLGKPWLKRHLPRKYRERLDQPQFTAKMNLIRCRERSASFDKLCRELEKRLP